MRLSTICEVARQHGVDLPSWDLEELRPYVQVVDDEPNYMEFLNKFTLLRRFYSTREAVVRVAYEAVTDAALDNIKYLELRFNPVALARSQGFSYEEVTDWVIEAVNHAQGDHGIQVRLIVQMNRHEPEYARRLVEVAAARQYKGIVGIDLAGNEVDFPATPFYDVFRWGKSQGLRITAHAAEWGPPEHIREAIEVLGAERIGHGVRAMEDLSVIDLIMQKRITLEMCPTSNLQTGSVTGLGQHPIWAFHQIGIPVTVNTDDPSISNTTLTDELLVTMQGIGVPLRAIHEMTLNAARAAFLPPNERDKLVSWFRSALSRNFQASFVAK